MAWLIKHFEHAVPDSVTLGDQIAEFEPEKLQFTLNKGEIGAHEISYEVSRDSESVSPAFVGPYRTDFQLWYENTCIMAGPHTLLNISSRDEHCKVGGKDWLHLLEDMSWPYDPTDPLAHMLGIPTTTDFNPPPGFAYKVDSREVMSVITDLLDYMLAQDNAPYFDYTLSSISHNIPYEVDLTDTENMLSRLQMLSQEDPGEFDFWVDPLTRELIVDAPKQYVVADVVNNPSAAEWIFDKDVESSGLSDVEFTNLGPLATRLMGIGASSGSKDLVAVNEYVPASEAFRLKMRSSSFGNAYTQTRVQNLNRKALLLGLNPVHEISLSVIPDLISNFWTRFRPGKSIWLKADLEGWVIDSAQEIVTIGPTVDNQGNVIINFGLNQIYAAEDIDP